MNKVNSNNENETKRDISPWDTHSNWTPSLFLLKNINPSMPGGNKKVTHT